MAKSKRKTRGIDSSDYGSMELDDVVDWINGTIVQQKNGIAKQGPSNKGIAAKGKQVASGNDSGQSSNSGNSALLDHAERNSLGFVDDGLGVEILDDGGKIILENINRSSTSGIKFDSWDRKAVGERVKIVSEDIKKVEENWGFGLVGYIAGMNPGKAAIFTCCNTWKVKYKVFFHGSGWIIFKFQSKADRDLVLKRGPYKVYGKPLLLKMLTELFAFNEDEISMVPVWVKLPNLPVGLWNKSALGKIASNIGKPIQSDNFTQTMQALSYARLLVEVDIAKEARYDIEIDLPNGDSMVQKVVYEFLPRFCANCKCLGHSTNVCGGRIGVKRKKGERAPSLVSSAVASPASSPSGHVVFEDTATNLAHATADRTARPASPCPASPSPSRPTSPPPPRPASPPRCPDVPCSVCPARSATQGPPPSSALQLIPPSSLPFLSSSRPDPISFELAANAQAHRPPFFHFPPILLPIKASLLPVRSSTKPAAKAAPPEAAPYSVPVPAFEGNGSGIVKVRRRRKKEKRWKFGICEKGVLKKHFGVSPVSEEKSDTYRDLKLEIVVTRLFNRSPSFWEDLGDS